jgi:hypothetical protein
VRSPERADRGEAGRRSQRDLSRRQAPFGQCLEERTRLVRRVQLDDGHEPKRFDAAKDVRGAQW